MVIKNNIYIILYTLFISNTICNGKKYLHIKLLIDSEIILIIKGKNTQKILNNESIELCASSCKYYAFNSIPSEIIINGNKANYIDYYVYNLSLEINNITIKFNVTLKNVNVMYVLWFI